jgi:virulence-associated protein VapD
MFAIAFDLVVADTADHHPKGVSQAYADIGATLANFGFDRVQGSLYINNSEDLANLFAALMALKALARLPKSVRDIRAFRVEQWSDFTRLIKSGVTS